MSPPLDLYNVGFVGSLGMDGEDMSDIQFLGQLEFNGELVDLISVEFTADADQISFVPAMGKTFYHVKSKLYPVVNSIITGASTAPQTQNRRADVELKFDNVLKDVLTHDMETTHGSNIGLSTAAEGNAGQAGQYETNNHESMDGDGMKAILLTSTSTSGTYRVQLEGYTKDTGTSP